MPHRASFNVPLQTAERFYSLEIDPAQDVLFFKSIKTAADVSVLYLGKTFVFWENFRTIERLTLHRED
jgi:hypothetical protein